MTTSTSPSSIPAEAVEAAAKALWEPNERDDEWVGEYETYKDYLRAQATKVLEAAAPHMHRDWLNTKQGDK